MRKYLQFSLPVLSMLALAPIGSYGQAIQGPSSSQTPYVTPFATGVKVTSILTAGDMVGSYQCVGLPDGSGAFDNGDGTFTLIVNHEFGNTSGAVHAHGQKGAFNSKWIIKKSDLTVVSGSDLQQKIHLWNTATQSYIAYNAASTSSSTAFTRFCSGDLPAISAYYNSKTGKGTQARIMMNGEESGSEGRAMAHIVTGPEAGFSYELPYLGKASFENQVACPFESDTTIVVGTDDATPGQVYVYIGVKTNSGTEIQKAGLTGGTLYGISVSGLVTETSASVPATNTPFTLKSLGQVQNLSGSTINTNSNNIGITNFLRPEDAAWDPANPNDLYFVTTNAFNSPSRLWRVRFTDISKPSLGGTITAVLDGTEGQQMFDNLGIDHYGHILLQEDVGGNAHIGKIWQYDINTKGFTQVASHDPTRFVSGGSSYLTQDEEASGIFDAQEILGAGMWLGVDQAHYGISGNLVEGGQLFAFYNPDSYNANPEARLTGNGTTINDGDITPATADNTDFGNTNKGVAKSKTFAFKNTGPGKLVVTGVNFTGAGAADFSMTSAIVFPKTINANDSMVFSVRFLPTANGVHTATMNINSNDFDERLYNVSIQGSSVSPKIRVKGNNIAIIDGDATAGAANNTDFGTVNINTVQNKTFEIQNTGTGALTVTGISFTGTNATEFTIISAPSFPVTLAPAANQTITVQFKPTAVGTRMATINVASDDADFGTFDFALEGNGFDPTGVAATSSPISSIKLYPNPTGDEATISLTIKKDAHFTINVVDLQGRQAIGSFGQNLKAGEQQIKLNTANLANGTYLVQIASEEATTKIKMIVAH